MSERVPATNFSASWVRVDQTSDPAFYASLLDATRAQGLDQARRDPGTAFGPLELRAGLRVLDVGCGTGGYLRILAPLVAPGPAVGIDLSATLIAQAQQRTAAGEANVSFRAGNAYDLPFPDASFDRVVATQILLHLADPWRAVTEMRRVLAPGGLISVGEWDWDSTCLAVTDRELGRRFTHLLCDQMHNGLIVRELPWQLEGYGFTHVTVAPQVHLSREPGAAYQWLIEPVARELARTGVLAPGEGDRLLDDLRERAAAGRYFLARTYYSVIATAGTATPAA
ncbi:MAG TPA: methyltransferase domain-containing protein [Streptosporangiaceae bacterium]|jgi:ubiquinone/menaquinone biosynthesis C-methylase UbiE